jgi:hypothetical protein
MYHMIAIDIDDTFFGEANAAPQENVEALCELDHRGVHVILCSGRPTPSTMRIAQSVFDSDRPHYIISYNGAVVREVESGRELSRRGVSLQVALEIVRYAREHGLLAQYYHDDEFFTEAEDPRAEEYSRMSGLPYRAVGPLEAFMDEESPKLLMQGDPAELPVHLQRLRRQSAGRWNTTISKPMFLEVLNPAVDKGKAMVELADYLGVPRDAVVAVGDSLNDIEMLHEAAVGVAVANARDEVKAAADMVTERMAGQGAVAEVVGRLFSEE